MAFSKAHGTLSFTAKGRYRKGWNVFFSELHLGPILHHMRGCIIHELGGINIWHQHGKGTPSSKTIPCKGRGNRRWETVLESVEYLQQYPVANLSTLALH